MELSPQKKFDLLQSFILDFPKFSNLNEVIENYYNFVDLIFSNQSKINGIVAMILDHNTFDFVEKDRFPKDIEEQTLNTEILDLINSGSLSSALNEGRINISAINDEIYKSKILLPLTSINGPLGYLLLLSESLAEDISEDALDVLKLSSFQLATYLRNVEIESLQKDFDLRLNNEVQHEVQQLEEHNQELEKQRRLAETDKENIIRANKSKSIFLSSISHELRTPLNSIIGFTDLLHAEDLPEKAFEYITYIQKSSEGLLSIINDIMEFTEVESDTITLDEKSFDIISEVENVIHLLEVTARDKGIKLEIEISGFEENRWHIGDPMRLKQVLIGLINNAINNTYDGFVKLWIIASDNSSSQTTNFKFVIEDTGIGLSPTKLKELFKIFDYSQVVRPDSPMATGLGLAISKKLIDFMGGHLEATSTENKGSEFYFTIELSKSFSGPNLTAEHLENQNLFIEKIKNKNALIVEDNVFNLKLIIKILEKWNVNITQATNGRDAVDICYKETFDFILMDYQMPIMDGIEAVNYIRIFESKNQRQKMPIIALTANALKNDRQKFLTAGFDEYLIKPFKQIELIDILNDLVD